MDETSAGPVTAPKVLPMPHLADKPFPDAGSLDNLRPGEKLLAVRTGNLWMVSADGEGPRWVGPGGSYADTADLLAGESPLHLVWTTP